MDRGDHLGRAYPYPYNRNCKLFIDRVKMICYPNRAVRKLCLDYGTLRSPNCKIFCEVPPFLQEQLGND